MDDGRTTDDGQMLQCFHLQGSATVTRLAVIPVLKFSGKMIENLASEMSTWSTRLKY